MTQQLRLVAYRQVWTGKSRDGRQYDYDCAWSDGSESRECSLPWGNMEGATELPTVSQGPAGNRDVPPMSLAMATNAFCERLASPYRSAPVMEAAE